MAYPSPEPETIKSDEYHTRVLLLPISTSALESLNLPGNRDNVGTIPLAGLPTEFLPSCEKNRGKTLAFRLYENLDNPYFVLGSDKSCQIQLQTTIDECWVNIRHCLLIAIPDDEDDAILLRNSSTSRFTAKNVVNGEDYEILPGDRLRICPGLMHLTLGAGLEFLLKVLPSSSSNTHSAVPAGVCELLSGPAIPRTPKSLRRKKGASKDTADVLHSDKRIKSEVAPSKVISCKASSPKLDLVAETRLTCVFKLQRFGRVVAAKVCRKPDIEDAVYMWENERKVLQALKHRNIVQLLDFRAPDLTLFLEYIEGLDLSHDGGSPSYTPPELLVRQRGKPSDIWAFGVTMLFVLRHIQLPSNGWPIRRLMEDSKVRKKFMTWWDQIDTLRKKLPRRMSALREMLALDPQRRISASALYATLNKPTKTKKNTEKRLVLKC
ncbi:CAMK family protein kinase [Arthroderma uncinatum]|uniref:CAMK family protein kinase n=1 Tax=Arthroderma uncinatum TaxID=74035 RepID=UPI00144A7556|nr:CAMK family protein kinase [Arthroderma uncinatum]KAF3490667.1 CAMK family protein kinase [Arthroderma uncinatum]